MTSALRLSMAVLLFGTAPAWAEPMTREAALGLALANNPRVSAALAGIEGAEGAREQAALRPNPEAALDIENFAGQDELKGFDGAEATLEIRQEIELAGKRAKRSDIAAYQTQIAREQAMAESLSLLAEADYAFMRLAIAQERMALAEKRLHLADETHDAVKKRVSAAAASDIQHTKADIEQSAAKLAKVKTQSALAKARSALAALLVAPVPDGVQAGLEDLPDVPEREALLAGAQQSPQIRAGALAQTQAQSQFDLAKAMAVPNPTFGLGIRRFQEDDGTALVAGVSFPLPVFNRNQGEIRQAKAAIAQADAAARQQEIGLTQMAESVWDRLMAAYQEAQNYSADMVPAAERAYAQASEGYRAGRFSFLDLLDAQRTLYEVQEARLDSLSGLYQAKAEAEFLMGVHTPLIENMFQGE